MPFYGRRRGGGGVLVQRKRAAASSSSSSAAAAHVYTFANRSSVGDPSAILTSASAAGAERGVVTQTIGSPGAATIPNATNIGGAYVEWLIRDLTGAAALVDSHDLSKFTLWLRNAVGVLPVDTYVAVALTAGGVAGIGNSGVVWGLRYSATGNEAFMQRNVGAGAGWAAALVAGAVDPMARGISGGWLQNNSSTNSFANPVPVDASGKKSAVSGSSPIAPSGGIFVDGPVTHIAIVVGWSGVAGVAGQVLPVALRGFAAAWSQLVDAEPILDEAAVVPASVPTRFALIGDSNINSTTIDATHAGGAIPGGWTFRDIGVNLATYPATGSPGVGCVPYLIAAAAARGAAGGFVARRGINGADTSIGTVQTQINNLISDAAALGGDYDVIIVCYGANDAQDATESAAYLGNMDRHIRALHRQWPSAIIVLWLERDTDSGTYPELAVVIAGHIATLAARFSDFVRVARATDSPAAGLFDAIHLSTGGGGGQSVMATRTFAAIYG